MYKHTIVKIDLNRALGVGEAVLGALVISFSFMSIVIFGTLQSEWYFRLSSWFAILVSFDLIRTGRQKFAERERSK